ncbi:MAG: glutamate synthase subunit beta [Helicobacter sp.]|nr:glutamate synthase subunit beta [Helicobacter sp.]
MGYPRGFLDIERENPHALSPKERIGHYHEFYSLLDSAAQQRQAARCMDCGVAFCHAGIAFGAASSIGRGDIGCPLRNLIPEFNDLVCRGLWEQAHERLSLTNPFPEWTGRVCPALCEDSCVCGLNGEPVAIKSNELAIIENAFARDLVRPLAPQHKSGRKVAIVGSGPAGLACAWELCRLGHSVCVFERSDRIGGLLMYGIPDMKLDKQIVNRRVALMRQSGIEFVTGTEITTQADATSKLAHFDAVVLAVGASKPIDLDIEGRGLSGIMFAVDYLTQNTKSLLDSGKADTLAKNKRVLVIGSGDTSVDCIAVAIRQGAKSITRFERSPKRAQQRQSDNPWPLKKDVFATDYGLSEAIAHYGKDPREYQKLTKAFRGKNGKVSAALAVDLEWSVVNGKKTRQELSQSQREYEADLVLLAMGFSGVEESVRHAFGIATDSRNRIITHRFCTSVGGIYACGDARIGQSLVVWAIKDGIDCARAVDGDLRRK